jgi:hypothetical protein
MWCLLYTGSPPTRAAPCTPGACMLDTEEAASPLALDTQELTCEETRPEHTPPKNEAPPPPSVSAPRLTGVSVSVSISGKARGTLAKATARAEDAAAAVAPAAYCAEACSGVYVSLSVGSCASASRYLCHASASVPGPCRQANPHEFHNF